MINKLLNYVMGKNRQKKRLATKQCLYFAYGSNLDITRLQDRIGKCVPYKKFILKNYELKFNCGTKKSTFANIIPCDNKHVEGVLFEVNYWQITVLDRYEGLYDRYIFDLDGREVHFYTSTCIESKPICPTKEYLDCILFGCKEYKLEQTQKMVEEIYDRAS